MKKFLTYLLTVCFIFAPVLTANAIHEEVSPKEKVAMPGPDAADLSEYIIKKRPYTEWSLWPGKGKMYKGREPHGAFLTTYVNDTAYWSITKKRGMSDGSIIVKENYTPEKKLDALTVMYKIKGYNPAAGDWFWAKYSTDGKVLASGKADACINCHGQNKDNDYIMTGKVKKAKK